MAALSRQIDVEALIAASRRPPGFAHKRPPGPRGIRAPSPALGSGRPPTWRRDRPWRPGSC
eukprot:2061907-Alexandrium_andersonii.AAC.1